MRFDPKLIQPEDAPLDACGDIDLPDDLADLAAQLGDDAAWLAERYPAPLMQPLAAELVADAVAAPPQHLRGWVIVGSSVAAALLVALGLAARPANDAPSAPVTEHAAAPPEVFVAAEVADISPTERTVSAPLAPRAPRIERLPWAPQPALGEVSGPELEGLLDLWQNDEHPAQTRIEI